ncbi:restriction endonuclease subunit S [Heyndrickxia faecalis]|uniref:restriction endonuclease subunit S n=1 Tax=Heyndrickxia faecalis TaxID=2824910 RepID=UPI001FFD6B74|nr:restriction endonuclease subunit S [Heyndrickxia faecalis]
MEQKNMVPKRRFKEFQNTSAWEQRKVGEIFKVTRGQVLAATETSENKTDETPYPVYSSQTKNDGLMGYYKDYLFDTAITWTTDGANAGTVNYRNGKFYSTNVNGVLLSDEGYANKAVAEALNLVAWKYVSRVGNPKLMNNTMSDIIISLPLDIKEQDKISEFLESIDHLITLHQRKLEKMKALKSAYLSEMFPAEGERVPKRRFAGFTQPWEQRKFIELLDVKDGIRRGPFGSALKKDLFVPKSDYVVYEQQNAIYDKWETRYYITKEKFEELHKFVLSEGDFIMSGAGTIGRIAKVPKGIKKGVFNQALIRFKINPELTDSNYFLEWIRSNEMQRKFTGSNPGSAMTNLVPMSEVKEWVISLPSLAEQKKIGDFFAELSDIITLHQRKLEKLQNIKKAYLNEMFV